MNKKTQGRKKIEIKQLENSSNKQVTFSKRRAGIFKKVVELTVLCGADVAVIVFSSADKVFCYGHPNINAVLDSYQNGLNSVVIVGDKVPNVLVAEFNKKYMEAEKEFEVLKSKAMEMKKMVDEKKKTMKEMNVSDEFWWDQAVDLGMMDEQEAEQYLTGPPVSAVHRLCHMSFMSLIFYQSSDACLMILCVFKIYWFFVSPCLLQTKSGGSLFGSRNLFF